MVDTTHFRERRSSHLRVVLSLITWVPKCGSYTCFGFTPLDVEFEVVVIRTPWLSVEAMRRKGISSVVPPKRCHLKKCDVDTPRCTWCSVV